MRAAQTFQNKPTDHLLNWGFPSRHTIPLGSSRTRSRKQSECGRHGLSNILNYKQRSCIQIITNEQVKLMSFIMRGGRFHAGNTLCTFKSAHFLLAPPGGILKQVPFMKNSKNDPSYIAYISLASLGFKPRIQTLSNAM